MSPGQNRTRDARGRERRRFFYARANRYYFGKRRHRPIRKSRHRVVPFLRFGLRCGYCPKICPRYPWLPGQDFGPTLARMPLGPATAPISTPPAPLPLFVERDPHCRPDVTLDNCERIRIELVTPGPRRVAVMIARTPPASGHLITPTVPGMTYRQLRPGDVVACRESLGLGPVATVKRVSVYR